MPALEDRRYDEHRTVEETDSRSRLRTHGERDRDRVLYSTAFQRLAGITQVVPTGTGHVVHSRLTHSLKVAQVARRLAQRLVEKHPELAVELDADRVEASALVHDLGHPPFGHIAETVLDRFACERDTDGFEGNAQSFRLVTRLAKRWPPTVKDGKRDEWGLNLTRGTLDGMLKYPWLRDAHDEIKKEKWGAYSTDSEAFEWVRQDSSPDKRCLAAAVMDWADDLTYAVHDMEDFFRAGLIPLDRLCTSQQERDNFIRSFKDLKLDIPIQRLKRFDLSALQGAVENIFDRLDFVSSYAGRGWERQVLRERSSFLIRDYLHAMELRGEALQVDEALRTEVAVLKELTWFYVIERPDLATVQDGQRRIIGGICDRFWEAADKNDLHLFPPLEQEELRDAHTDASKARVVCDFVGRLTEDRALELHKRLLGTSISTVVTMAH
jgi:dGTPase